MADLQGVGGCTLHIHICVVFTGVPGLILFTKLSAGIEQVVGFIIIY